MKYTLIIAMWLSGFLIGGTFKEAFPDQVFVTKDSDVELDFSPKFTILVDKKWDEIARINMNTGEVTLKGDPNEAAKVFWKAVTSNHPECLKGEGK